MLSVFHPKTFNTKYRREVPLLQKSALSFRFYLPHLSLSNPPRIFKSKDSLKRTSRAPSDWKRVESTTSPSFFLPRLSFYSTQNSKSSLYPTMNPLETLTRFSSPRLISQLRPTPTAIQMSFYTPEILSLYPNAKDGPR